MGLLGDRTGVHSGWERSGWAGRPRRRGRGHHDGQQVRLGRRRRVKGEKGGFNSVGGVFGCLFVHSHFRRDFACPQKERFLFGLRVRDICFRLDCIVRRLESTSGRLRAKSPPQDWTHTQTPLGAQDSFVVQLKTAPEKQESHDSRAFGQRRADLSLSAQNPSPK